MIVPLILPDGTPQWIKDPGAVKDYSLDWSNELGTDEISTAAWTAPAGITLSLPTHTATVSTVWISGGTKGRIYRIKNQIITTGGRTLVKYIEISVKEQ